MPPWRRRRTSSTCSSMRMRSWRTSSPVTMSSASTPDCGRCCSRSSRRGRPRRRPPEHTVMEVEPALSAIAGGKFTTYRVMAEDAVDFALGDDAKDRRSLTESVPLLGAQGVGALRRGQSGIAEKYGWDEDRVKRLIRRYGTLI